MAIIALGLNDKLTQDRWPHSPAESAYLTQTTQAIHSTAGIARALLAKIQFRVKSSRCIEGAYEMVKHLVLGVVVALIVTACSSADAGLFRRRGGCPGGKCGVPAKSASTQSASTTQIAAAR